MTGLRSRAGWVALLALLMLIPSPTASAQMPPQLPSQAELEQLQAELSTTLSKVRAAQASLDEVIGTFEKASHDLGHIAANIAAVELKLNELHAEIDAAQASINRRASSVYKQERLGVLGILLGASSYREFLVAFRMMRSVTEEDHKSLLRITELREQVRVQRLELEGRKQEQNRLVADLDRQRDGVERSLKILGAEYQKVQAELNKRKSGFAFPVRAPYSYGDSWGAPRMEGTSYYHRHEGTDIFALKGTPVVAVVDGVLEKVGTAPLGGIKLWLRSPGDNWTYYYAHLSGYAPGIQDGLVVKKGDVLGYVGDTGNARGTPPHLHFETHIPSGPAVNPFPILRRVDPLR